jgi:CDP-glucose 4,6-dehydratase
MDSGAFYKGKRILLTGNTGFKGSWLTLLLHHYGAVVFGFAKKEALTGEFNFQINICANLKQFYGDITDKTLLEKTIVEVNPDIIFHLAAQPLVSTSYVNPFETINTNAFGTLCLLEVLRNYTHPCKLVVVTSDKCYKIKKGKKEYAEEDELGGLDPYSFSKAMQEQLTETYYNNFFSASNSLIKCCSLRSGNVIGGGDFSESRLIPDILKSIHAKEGIILRNPLAVRPWIYVLDTLSAYLLAAKGLFESPEISGQAFNVGPDTGELRNVNEVVNLFVNAYSPSEKIPVTVQTSASYKESDYLFLSNTKIKRVLAWNNKTPVNDAVNYTANWYKKYNDDKSSIVNFSLSQIEKHLAS